MPRQLLDRYELAEVLGEGAMGTVYRGHDQRLDRDVAIKLLRAETLADDEARRRFRREALALSKLNHPNIASIFDFGTQDGTDFIVMELVAGHTLADRFRQSLPSEHEIARIGAQLAEGLDAAHRAGVVHRDLKPANLRLTPDGRLKILDFGIAKQVAVAGVPLETMTATAEGVAVGTPVYMAPEQLRGEAIDARSDIYAAGAVLYQMATGRPPHEDPSPALLADAVLHQPPVAPRALNPRLSPGLESVILKALDKDPEQRYQSARELGVDLHRLLAAETARTAIPVGGPSGRGRHAVTRHWALGLSAAGAVVIAVVAVWLMGTRTALSFAPRDWILLADVQNDTDNPLFDRSLTTAFRISLEQSTHANVLPPARVSQALRRMGKPKVEHLDEELGREICVREHTRGLVTSSISRVGSQYVLSAQLIDPASGNRVRTYSERADREDHILDGLDRIARALRRDLGESLATIQQGSRPLPQVTTSSLQALKLYSEGSYLWGKGDYDNGVRQVEAALAEDPEFAMAHAALGTSYMSFIYNDRLKWRQHLERALELANRTSDRERLLIQVKHAEELGTPAQAERLCRLYLSQYPDDAAVRYNFGSMLMRWTREREAIAQLSEVVRVAPTFASAYINLATSQRNIREYKEALSNYDKAFTLEPDWKLGGNLNHEYGFAFVEIGDHEKAREVFSLALARPQDRARALRSMALLDVYEGQHRHAIATFREAALTNESARVGTSAARDRLFLATTLLAVGDRTGALRELDAAVALLPTSAPQLWMSARIGQAYARAGAARKAADILSATRPHAEANNVEHQSELHVLEGEIELARDHPARALELFDLAYRERPWPLTMEPLARAELAQKLTDRGVERFRTLVGLAHRCLGWEAQTPWLNAHYTLARLLAERGERDEARRVIDQLLRIWKDSDGSPTLLAQAKALSDRIDGRRP